MSDRVIIREWRNPHDPTDTQLEAFLPDSDANFGHIVSYAHIGQHSEANADYYLNCTHAVDYTRADVLELIGELRSIGYDVRLTKRLNRPFGGWAR